MTQSEIERIDRDAWLRENFPEWGTILNEEIDETVVSPDELAMWWLGCTSIWHKTSEGTNIVVDFWAQRGVATKKAAPYEQERDKQLVRMTGSRVHPPFIRISPHVIDPFAVTKLDAVLSTHIHEDHICKYTAAATVKNTDAIFIGPSMSGDKWESWGVPKSRIVRVKPGDEVKVKDTTIVAVESFDRTVLLSPPPYGDLRGKPPLEMDERAVNYIIKTPAGSIYHSGDSHFSNYYLKQGRDHEIDVCFVSFGENGPGMTDKVSSVDALRIAWSLNAKLLIPVHYDLWTTQAADPNELVMLYNFNKHLYKFKLFIWKVGGMFTWPDDQDKGKYQYSKGEEDYFVDEPNIPFRSFI